MAITRRQFLTGATALCVSGAIGGTLSGCGSSETETKTETPTSYFYINGNVFTGDADNTWTEAFAVTDGKFAAVGTTEEIKALATDSDEIIDLYGTTVIPGLIEGHTHFGFMAAMHSLGYTEIPAGVTELDASLKQVKKFVADHPDYDQYVMGNFSQGLDLGAKELDEICADKPVACVGMGLHCVYVNSKFMEIGQITKDTPDAIPGETYYVRDEDGNPTGKIVELPQTWDAFQKAIKVDNDKVKEKYLELQDTYHSYGFTGIAEGGFLGLDEANMLDIITDIEKDGDLKMVVCPASIWYGHTVTDLEEVKERACSNKENYTTDLVRPGTVKMWADGTIGAHSALMREPYADKDTCGVHLNTVEDLTACAEMCRDNDLNIHYHAIGDQAIENVLTAYEAVGETTGTKSIVHFQINAPDLIERASKIDGLIVNMTPTWSNVAVTEEVEPLGDRRNTNGLYKEAMDAGITVNFGADSNGSESAWNPSMIMDVAMIRNPKKEGFFLKGEPCSFEEAVCAYSINVAKERRIDSEFGSIEEGKFANFVIWDKETMDDLVDDGEAGFIKGVTKGLFNFARYVFFKGEVVYTRD